MLNEVVYEDAPINLSQSSSEQQAVFSKGLREQGLSSSPRNLFSGKSALVGSEALCVHKGPVNPPAATDAHPADVVGFASLASSHQAVLGSAE